MFPFNWMLLGEDINSIQHDNAYSIWHTTRWHIQDCADTI